MPCHSLPAATVLLFLLSADAHSSAILATLQTDVDKTSLAIPTLRHKSVLPDPDPLFQPKTSASGVLQTGPLHAGSTIQRILADHRDIKRANAGNSDYRGRQKTLGGLRVEFPFPYLDLPGLLRKERLNARRPGGDTALIELPLPASGWLLSSVVLCGLLVGTRQSRSRPRGREPLRYQRV